MRMTRPCIHEVGYFTVAAPSIADCNVSAATKFSVMATDDRTFITACHLQWKHHLKWRLAKWNLVSRTIPWAPQPSRPLSEGSRARRRPFRWLRWRWTATPRETSQESSTWYPRVGIPARRETPRPQQEKIVKDMSPKPKRYEEEH